MQLNVNDKWAQLSFIINFKLFIPVGSDSSSHTEKQPGSIDWVLQLAANKNHFRHSNRPAIFGADLSISLASPALLPQLPCNSMDSPYEPPSTRRKRQQRKACDLCRRRKVRCDIDEQPGNTCSVCDRSGLECRYAWLDNKW